MQRFISVFVLAILSCHASSQDFSGGSTCRSDAGLAHLTLTSNAGGEYAGTLEASGMTLALQGRVKNNTLSGIVGDESEGMVFRAQWNGKQLVLNMFEPDERGNPIPETTESLTFQRSSHSPGLSQKRGEQSEGGVVINGIALCGRYWLDHQGNAGYEGNPTPVINLFVAAQQNGYSGQGGSGDNFWTSRFSAGNSDSGGQRGYVSVPGYGPVGYGF